jgi:hypothetical protein
MSLSPAVVTKPIATILIASDARQGSRQAAHVALKPHRLGRMAA